MAASDVLLISILLVTVGLGLFIIFFVTRTMTSALINIPAINTSTQTVETLHGINNTTNRFDYLFLAVFVGLTLAIIISGYFTGGHPIFMFVYFLIITISVISAAFMSNFWDTIDNMTIFNSTINSFPITNHVLSNLPYYIAVIGIIGLLAMFAKPYVGGEA